MPKISRLFIKTGLIFFILSLGIGILLETEHFSRPQLVPLFWHTLMVGWITQIIFGVSIWMFPGRHRDESIWNQKKVWGCYLLLNTGLLLRIVFEPLAAYAESAFVGALLLVSALSQLAAAILYFAEMWPRIQSRKEMRKKRKKN